MDKKNKYFCCLIVFFVLSLFFSANFCFATAQLEIDYPPLANGGSITNQTPISGYLKYIFDLGIILGTTLAIGTLIFAGALYILSSAVPSLMAKAKNRALGALYGLLILFLIYLIITTINPQLKFFGTTGLTNIPVSKPPPPPGITFFYTNNCSNNNIPSTPDAPQDSFNQTLNTDSIKDLGMMRNKTKSVKIVQQPETNTYYFTILYKNINYYGMCQRIDKAGCTKVDPFASSAVIYQKNLQSGGGVTFYRHAFYGGITGGGGLLTINGSEIKNGYVHKLDGPNGLKFKDVPEEEQDCTTWNLKGECLKKQPPDLSGDHINSIKINGEYVVLLVYFADNDTPTGPWSYCQNFPTYEDINKEGPKQIKWEYIRRNNQYPNYVVILPIVNNI